LGQGCSRYKSSEKKGHPLEKGGDHLAQAGEKRKPAIGGKNHGPKRF